MMFFIQPEHRFLSFLRRRVRFWTAEARGSLCTGEEVTKATSPASILASTRSFKVLARMSRRIEADGRPLPTTLILFLQDWKFQNKQRLWGVKLPCFGSDYVRIRVNFVGSESELTARIPEPCTPLVFTENWHQKLKKVIYVGLGLLCSKVSIRFKVRLLKL